MRSFTLRTLWKRPATLRTLMARRVVSVRLAEIGRVGKVVEMGVASAGDVGGAMGATGIGIVVASGVGARLRRRLVRRARHLKSLAAMLR